MPVVHLSFSFQNGDTALHIAAAMGRRKLTRVLLESNCNRNIRNKVIFCPDADSGSNPMCLESQSVGMAFVKYSTKNGLL